MKGEVLSCPEDGCIPSDRTRLLPMNEIELNHEALADYLPHRGPNLIPDTVWLAEDLKSSRSVTHIQPGDDRDREWFCRNDADGKKVWNEPFPR